MTEQATRFDVRVLCCRATPSAAERSALGTLITADEERQRNRFHRQQDADRFLVGRGTLRRELGRMLDIAPRDVSLELGDHGKPHVVGGTPHVNVSHSGSVVLIAVTAGASVGVDVERIDPGFVERAMIERSFSAREIEDLASLPKEMRVSAFFHIWSSREAVMKVVGLGLSLPREDFDVSVDPRLPPTLLTTRTALVTRPLTLVSIPVPSGHTGVLAVAAEEDAFRVSLISDPVDRST